MTCECTTVRVGGARPSTIDAWPKRVIEDACECHALPPLGVKMTRMYEAGVTTGEPAGAIISPMTTTAHGPKTSDIMR